MKRRFSIPFLLAPLVVGCASHAPKKTTSGTLAELHNIRPDVQEARVEQGLDQAMQQYRRFLEEAPENKMTPEAMRRLADLQIEKQFGIRNGDTKPKEMAAPEPGKAIAEAVNVTTNPLGSPGGNGVRESDQEFEKRATAESAIPAGALVKGFRVPWRPARAG